MRVIEREILLEGQAPIDRTLASEAPVMLARGVDTVWSTSVRIDDRHYLDVSVMNGDPPYSSAVLSEDGREILVFDPREDIFGEYELPSLDAKVVLTREPAPAFSL